jgi:hypothetical protein
VGGAFGRTGQHRQDRCGAIERLDLALLIDAQHDRALGREQPVEPMLGNRATMLRSTPSRSAISVFLNPSAAASTIRARCASVCALVRRRAHASNCLRSASDNSIATATGIRHTPLLPAATDLTHQRH